MEKTIRVVPAILTDDPAALEAMVRQAETFTDNVQIDIMDGRFVPSKSVTWEQVAGLSVRLNWEAHLMVMEPEKYLDGFKQAGAGKIVFHHEASASPHAVISRIKDLGLEVGLAISPETPVSAADACIHDIDSVLLLTVTPRFYGSQFIPEVMDKVPELRRIRPGIQIGVDGGVKESNIGEIAAAGVDYICVGSAVFRQRDPAESYRRLQSLARVK